MSTNTKEEALEQLQQIHSTLTDSKFIPYDYRMMYLWGAVSIVLFLFTGYLFTLSLLWGFVLFVGILTLAGLIETYFIKKANKKYDIEKCTDKQQFIGTSYNFSMVFAILLMYLFISKDMMGYIIPTWMLLLGIATYSTGFTANNIKMAWVGIVNFCVGSLLYLTAFIFGEQILLSFTHLVAAIITGGGFIYIGYIIKNECEVKGV